MQSHRLRQVGLGVFRDNINIFGGSDYVIRRCFYDGRETSGYVGNFVRASGTNRLAAEDCVMINGMGERQFGFAAGATG